MGDNSNGANQLNKAPVVVIGFNRPEHSAQVLSALRSYQPERVFWVVDGPRQHDNQQQTTDEQQACQQVIALANQIDWPCQVERIISQTNMGCRRRVISALNHVFAEVETAIILEDDCIPSPWFFTYCEDLLQRYTNNPKVWAINGTKLCPDHSFAADYHFSKYMFVWGWATWRRSWQQYDEHITDWPELKATNAFADYFHDDGEAAYWSSMFDQVYDGSLDAWGPQWQFAAWKQQQSTAVPSVNLISNVGFGRRATHTDNPNDSRGYLARGQLTVQHHPAPFKQQSDTKSAAILQPIRDRDYEAAVAVAHCRVNTNQATRSSKLYHSIRHALRWRLHRGWQIMQGWFNQSNTNQTRPNRTKPDQTKSTKAKPHD